MKCFIKIMQRVKGMNKKFLIMCLLTAAVASPHYAKADEIIPGVIQAPEVVISATRTAQLIEDVPSAMEVITAQEIQRMGAQDVQQILAKSFNLITDGHNGGFSIRGLDSSATKVLINGRAPVVYGSKNETVRRTLDLIPAENIERIEILRGPASALYGEAMGGVINIITKASIKQETTLSLTYGSRYYDLGVRHDWGKMGNWSNVFAAEFMREWGYNDEDSKFNSGISDAHKFYRNEIYLNNSLAYTFDRGDKLQLDSNFFYKENAARNYYSDPFSEMVYSNTLSYQGNYGDHSLSSGLSHSQTTRGNKDLEANELYTIVTFDAQDSWYINDNHTLTFGTKMEFGNADTNPNVSGTNQSQETYGFYVQDEISLFDEKLYIVPALRYDYYSSFGSYVAPKIGLTYEYIDNHRFKANFGTGYSAPNLTQLYGRSQGGYGVTLPSPDLEPEENVSWEARLEGNFTSAFSYAIGYFHNDITNMIVLNDTPDYTIGSTKYYTAKNIGKARTQGVEIELSYDFLEYFTAGIQYAYTDAKNVTDNERLTAIPYNSVLASLDFNYTPWDIYSSLWVKYNGGFKDQEYSDDTFDFYRVSFSLTKEFQDKYSVTFNANNFLQSAAGYQTAGYVEPTEYKLNFTMKF